MGKGNAILAGIEDVIMKVTYEQFAKMMRGKKKRKKKRKKGLY